MKTRRIHPESAPDRRGYTLIEVLVTVVIVSLMTALVFIAIGASVRTARQASQAAVLRSIKISVDQFKQQFGFLPPLVDDADQFVDLGSNRRRLRILGETTVDSLGPKRFLRYEVMPNAQRYSVRSLPYYLTGVLDKETDGVDGPGYYQPQIDGSFASTAPKTEPLYDVQSEGFTADPIFRDRWNAPIRFYRWEPVRFGRGSGREGQVDLTQTFVPRAVGYWANNVNLRSAGYAIVSLGADGRTDERPPLAVDDPMNVPPTKQKDDVTLDDLVELGE